MLTERISFAISTASSLLPETTRILIILVASGLSTETALYRFLYAISKFKLDITFVRTTRLLIISS